MRRLGLVVTAMSGVILAMATPVALAGVAPATAQAPTPSPSTPAAAAEPGAGQPVCTISDKQMLELSGLVAIDNGYWTINDSNDSAGSTRIFRIDNQCKAVTFVGYPSPAIDPEDLAIGQDGTLWVADIGDNDAKRSTVALWKLAPNSKAPVLYRLTYPDGARDAEAILIGGDGVPVIVTKEPGRPAGIYVPSAALVPNSRAGVPLNRAGEFQLPASQTPAGPVGPPGRLVITGGATAPDGKRVALRSYADAFEWDVPDGDVVKAVTTGKPRVTPLPNEAQGEAITYTRDGKSFITVSDLPQGKSASLLRYTPAVASAPPAKNAAPAETGADGANTSITLDQIIYLVAGVGLLGLLLVIIGVAAIRRSRRIAAAGGGAGSSPGRADGPGWADGGRADGGPGGSGGASRAGGAADGPVRATATAPVHRGIFDDDADEAVLRLPRGEATRGRAARGGPAEVAGRADNGLVDAPPPTRRGGAPPEPTSGVIYRASGGRPGGGAVYGARRDSPNPSERRGRSEDSEPFEDRRRGYRTDPGASWR